KPRRWQTLVIAEMEWVGIAGSRESHSIENCGDVCVGCGSEEGKPESTGEHARTDRAPDRQARGIFLLQLAARAQPGDMSPVIEHRTFHERMRSLVIWVPKSCFQ